MVTGKSAGAASVRPEIWGWVERIRQAAEGRRIVGVMGGGRNVAARDAALAAAFAKAVSDAGLAILTGGGPGIMEAASSTADFAIGVVPGLHPADGYPNRHVSVPFFTGLGTLDRESGDPGRNIVNVLASDAIVACRGAVGTASEIRLALSYGKPLALLGWGVPDLDQETARECTGAIPALRVFSDASLAATWAVAASA